MDNNKTIEYDYIIGADKNIRDILKVSDITPLLQSAVKAGAAYAAIEDDTGKALYQHSGISESPSSPEVTVKKPLYIEGEVAGYIIVKADDGIINTIGELMLASINTILKSSYKALLATETHKTVVHQSFEELLETNRKLIQSENKYRELANSLEKTVQQRTEELRQAHAKLLTQEKIVSIGQLAAGIAHEINNPLGFILSNINTLKQYVSKMKGMLVFYRDAVEKGTVEKELLGQKWKKLKLDFVFQDIEDLITESSGGAERVKKIVSDLKGFSHIDEAKEADADINKEIDRTINVLVHEIPGDAEIIRNYHEFPLFACNPADLCQAFFNIILNALQTGTKGLKLTITTGYSNGNIRVSFSDNGPGMPEDLRNRIFEPFFTTKEVGKGTGMGLNVTYEIITSYGGTIDVESKPGKGATFTISLPVTERAKQI
ncbi:MAG: HAMP domain-containing histidine kinase [Nitrospirae bacterium]|nr:HAMP domain-containing histidine kinase [Nitrospirota bacterium]